jgi:hypothetical protein
LEFPVRLSHRSGVSTSLFSWMRSGFNYGLGSKQFSDTVRMQHILRYDMLELQYLEQLASCTLDNCLQLKDEAFAQSDDVGPMAQIFIHHRYLCFVTFMTILLMKIVLKSINILRCSLRTSAQLIIVIRYFNFNYL